MTSADSTAFQRTRAGMLRQGFWGATVAAELRKQLSAAGISSSSSAPTMQSIIKDSNSVTTTKVT